MIRAVPIYDYRCDACGHAFSAVRSYTDTDVDACPQCGARPRKLLSSPAIVFKGSGWYKTDSRQGSDAAKADAKADGKGTGAAPATETAAKPAEAKGDGAGAKTVEAKPAASAEKTTKGPAS